MVRLVYLGNQPIDTRQISTNRAAYYLLSTGSAPPTVRRRLILTCRRPRTAWPGPAPPTLRCPRAIPAATTRAAGWPNLGQRRTRPSRLSLPSHSLARCSHLVIIGLFLQPFFCQALGVNRVGVGDMRALLVSALFALPRRRDVSPSEPRLRLRRRLLRGDLNADACTRSH
jgi:hypothetical protein